MKNGLDSRRNEGQIHIATMSSESANVEQFFFLKKQAGRIQTRVQTC